jgi:murein endopeptidase
MRRRRAAPGLLLALLLVLPTAGPAAARVAPQDPELPAETRVSRALGAPWAGRLLDGVQLPEAGLGFVSYDAVRRRMPNRPWRRWGTEELVDLVQDVTGAFAIRHPDAPPLLVGDLSRPYGGEFGRRFGGLGHASHQNGLDADVSYPRRDGLLRSPRRPGQVDRALAQDLVDRFVAAGAEKVFVGPRLGLTGPRRVVVPLVHHDDHLHVRIPRPRR